MKNEIEKLKEENEELKERLTNLQRTLFSISEDIEELYNRVDNNASAEQAIEELQSEIQKINPDAWFINKMNAPMKLGNN